MKEIFCGNHFSLKGLEPREIEFWIWCEWFCFCFFFLIFFCVRYFLKFLLNAGTCNWMLLAIKLGFRGIFFVDKIETEFFGGQTLLYFSNCISFFRRNKSLVFYSFVLGATSFPTVEWPRKLLFVWTILW